MKARMVLCSIATCGVLFGMGPSAFAIAYSFDAIGQTYAEDFNTYRGTMGTLPDHMFVTWDTSRDGMDQPDSPFTGVGDFQTSDPTDSYGGFTAYTSGSGSDEYSFGIREREPVDLRDARLYFELINNAGVEIPGFHISYDVEAWFIGDRRNRIRVKYDDALGAGRFEEDIISTDNPSSEATPGTVVDGSLAENRVRVSTFVDLGTLPVGVDDDPREFFGPLAPGESAFFRWQFSNTEGDEGSLRSGLGINNVLITAVPDPATLGVLAVGGLALLRRRRRA